MIIQSFEMDARRSGIEQGIQQGIQQGKSLGLAEGIQQGAYQKSLETAKNLIEMGLPIESIAKATGLSQTEIAALQ